jgi:hypothetical protein
MAKKELTAEEIVQIAIDLQNSKSEKRRNAAKKISKNRLPELGDQLYAAYLKEKEDKRTWETQYEMVKALGLIDYKKSLENIYETVRQNEPHDMITVGASLAYIRLKRKSLSDSAPVLELLEFGRISVIAGVVMVLAIDKMIPDNDAIEKIIKICWDLHRHKDVTPHDMDDRKYLAIACANWDKNLVKDFLNHCIETAKENDNNLREVSQNSLKGKYSKAYLGDY